MQLGSIELSNTLLLIITTTNLVIISLVYKIQRKP